MINTTREGAPTSVQFALPYDAFTPKLGLVVFVLLSSACGQTKSSGVDDNTSDSVGSTGASGSSTGVDTSAGASGTSTPASVGTSSSSVATSGPVTSSAATGSSTSTTGVGPSGGTAASTAASTTETDSSASAASSSTEGVGDAGAADDDAGEPDSDDGSMSFFVTSTGSMEGGNFGGLEGADAFCTQLAAAVSESLGSKTWRAYLSTSTVNARDRIGSGPWRNAEGVIVANSVDDLHAQEAGEALDTTWPPAELSIALTENGDEVPNNIHDILTGSLPDGTVDAERHCDDWTSSESTDEGAVGHSNRDGGGRPPYFNATHQVGCAPSLENYQDGTVTSGGGQGSIYCFALTSVN